MFCAVCLAGARQASKFFIFSSRFHRPYPTSGENCAEIKQTLDKTVRILVEKVAAAAVHIWEVLFSFATSGKQQKRPSEWRPTRSQICSRRYVRLMGNQSSNLILFDGYIFWIGGLENNARQGRNRHKRWCGRALFLFG